MEGIGLSPLPEGEVENAHASRSRFGPRARKARGSEGSQTRAAAISAASLALFFTRAMLVTRLRPAVSSSMRPST